MSDLVKSGDRHQYEATPHKLENPDDGVIPEVKLVWMTPDPLGVLAWLNGTYKGKFYDNMSEVTDDDRYEALGDMLNTHLTGPLEAIQLHFRFDGVDRALTHQAVRQRTAFFAQESLRFSVVGDLLDATSLPPSLADTHRWMPEEDENFMSPRQRQRMIWDQAIRAVDDAYHRLVEGGMPAEEARGLLPHATATRINYVTDLRNMTDHAGMRLCTQAQFHWRKVFNDVVAAIADYPDTCQVGEVPGGHRWQYRAIAESRLFRPVCYQLGHCPMKASFDRSCSIRGRVDAFSKQGVPSDRWDQIHFIPNPRNPNFEPDEIKPINPAEWLLNPGAARST